MLLKLILQTVILVATHVKVLVTKHVKIHVLVHVQADAKKPAQIHV